MNETPIIRTVRTAFWDYAALLLGRGLAVGLMLLVVSLITRLLGREGFGHFSVYLLVGQLFFLASVNWTGAAVVRFGREEFLETGRLGRTFWARNLILLVSTSIAVVVIVLMRRTILDYIGVPGLSVGLLILYLVVFTANNYAARLLQATENLRFFAFANSISHTVASAGLLVVLFLKPAHAMTAVILAYMLGKCASALYGFVRTGFKVARPVGLDTTQLKRILTFSYPLIVGTLCAYVVGSIDIFVIKHYLPEAEVGLYALAYQGLNVLQEVPLAAMTLTLPLLLTFRTENKDHLTRQYLDTVVPGAVFVWGLLLIPVVFLARPLIPLIFPSEFTGSVLSFRILCVALVFVALRSLYYAVYANYDMTRSLSLVSLILAVTNIVADVILVPRMRITGAAVGTCIAFALAASLDIVLCQRRHQVRQPAQMLLVLPVLVYVIIVTLTDSMLIDALAGVAVLTVSVIVARLIGLIDPSHLDLFARMEMPNAVRSALVWTYRMLARKGEPQG